MDSYKIAIEKNQYSFESIGSHGGLRTCAKFELSTVKNISL